MLTFEEHLLPKENRSCLSASSLLLSLFVVQFRSILQGSFDEMLPIFGEYFLMGNTDKAASKVTRVAAHVSVLHFSELDGLRESPTDNSSSFRVLTESPCVKEGAVDTNNLGCSADEIGRGKQSVCILVSLMTFLCSGLANTWTWLMIEPSFSREA